MRRISPTNKYSKIPKRTDNQHHRRSSEFYFGRVMAQYLRQIIQNAPATALTVKCTAEGHFIEIKKKQQHKIKIKYPTMHAFR